MLSRFNLRIPSWAVLTLAALGYALRSIIRGLDFSPDLPLDAIIAVMLAIALGARRWATAGSKEDRDHIR